VSLLLQKDKDPLTVRVIQFFEKMRMSYLSALSDKKTYGKKWAGEIKTLRQQWDDIDDFAQAIKGVITEKELFLDEAENIESDTARKIYEQVKELRYSSELVKDPFVNKYREEVLDKLMESEALFAQFIHWAIRIHDKSFSEKAWKKNDLEPDTITEGFTGLNLAPKDVVDFIVEHYGDGKDTKRIEGKFNAAEKLLEKIYVAHHSQSTWDNLVSFKKAEKAESHFLIPNKPMYRIFEIGDLEELKGFTGKWVVQEKYDGMRIQIHKIDDQVKIYSFNNKDITEKCPEQVKIMRAKHFGDCILDGELMLFDGEEPLHRAEVVARIFKNKKSDSILRAHVFDIMRHEGDELHDTELSERLTILFNNYSTHSDEMLAFPSKKDTRYADSIKEVKEYAEEIMEIPTAEGVVIKDITSTYFIGTKKNPKWIKWKKFVDLDLMVLDKKTTKSNLFSYTLGAGPLTDKDDFKNIKEIDDRKYLNVGKSLNTKIDVEIGKIIRVKIDEVKKDKDGGYKVLSAKVIEIPEVELPEKLITLDFLAQDTKKSLNYDIKALEKGYAITDTIHGEATLIFKSDLDGFAFYGFEENNLMAKNALLNIDIWKEQMEDMLKTQKSKFRIAVKNFLMDNKEGIPYNEIEEFVLNKHLKEFNNIFGAKPKKLKNWLKQLEDITYDREKDKFFANYDMIEKYETPKEYREGEFKIYHKENKNLSVMFKLDKELIGWEIDINEEDDIFALFGKSGKFPAQVENKFRKGKLIDSGKVKLGVQRHGYHEYFLEGNKFETKFHVRVIPVKGKDMWLAWTGVETKPVDPESDDGIWDIREDKKSKLVLKE
tara:strand:+ start:3574 stop:6054 length:2481 start_codon:yes stop_codon:yes gene_type:complete